jgi:hypothetical protein
VNLIQTIALPSLTTTLADFTPDIFNRSFLIVSAFALSNAVVIAGVPPLCVGAGLRLGEILNPIPPLGDTFGIPVPRGLIILGIRGLLAPHPHNGKTKRQIPIAIAIIGLILFSIFKTTSINYSSQFKSFYQSQFFM